MVFVIVGMGLVFMGLERVFPDRDLPPVPGWWVRCIGFNVLQALVVLGGGALWDHGFRTLSVFDLQHLPVLGQGAVGYLIATFVFYVWHRARHEVRPLWRLFHQMHHSPTRLETLTSFYKHPLEIVANALISTALVYGLLGLSVEGAACAAAMSAFAEFFYHVNIKTPRWLGWFIQRPEMHRLHHRRGHHDKNYSDLPIWDMLFGTYENPADVETPCGFDQEKERLLGHLLLARDVHCNRHLKRRLPGVGVIALLCLGLVQPVGWLLSSKPLRSLGIISVASPLPLVFTEFRGVETFAADWIVDLHWRNGRSERLELTPKLYSTLKGAYNRRNVYGAALAYGPALDEPNEQEWVRLILHYGFCDPGAVLNDFDREGGLDRVVVRVHSTTRGREGEGPWSTAVECSHAL